MCCSRKGKEKIYPNLKKRLSMKKIKECLENNIGCHIDIANISIYSREIREVLS